MQARKGRSVHFRSKLPTEFSLSVANSATSLPSHPRYHDQAKLQKRRPDCVALWLLLSWLCQPCGRSRSSGFVESTQLVLSLPGDEAEPWMKGSLCSPAQLTNWTNQPAALGVSGWSMDYMASDSYEYEAVKSSLASLFSKMTFLTFKNIIIIILFIIVNYIFRSSLIILAKILVEF